MLRGSYKQGQKVAYESIGYELVPLLILYPQKEGIHLRAHYGLRETDKLIDNHWHRSIEIIYTNQSDGFLILNGTRIYLPENTLYVINSKDVHCMEETHPDREYTGCAVQISYQFLRERWPDFDEYFFDVDEKGRDALLPILHLIIELYFGDRQKNRDILCSLLTGFVEYLVQYCAVRSAGQASVRSEKLTHILAFLEAHYAEDLSLRVIAEQFGISYTYLSRLFKDNLNRSAGQYIGEIRFKRALSDVSVTEDTITEIAYRHGFPSVSAFIRDFKKKKGVSPKQYRKMLQE